MNEIIQNLFIADRDAVETLSESEYRVLLISLRPVDREHVHVAIDDGEPWPCETVELVVNIISDWLDGGERVCVACDAGISRSASAVTAYLLFKKGMDIEDALDLVKLKRGITNPHPWIIQSIVKCSSQKKE